MYITGACESLNTVKKNVGCSFDGSIIAAALVVAFPVWLVRERRHS